jgi:hypothetical protein
MRRAGGSPTAAGVVVAFRDISAWLRLGEVEASRARQVGY